MAKARWIGAGWPDYPWLFATDGEYTGFAAVASGQFAAIEDHLRALRDVSLVANGNSGKVVHEVTPGRPGLLRREQRRRATPTRPRSSRAPWPWCGAGPATTRSATRCTASRAQHAATSSASSTPTRTAGPRASATSSVTGMGEEKLDNTVYTIRGLRDLADLAASKGDTATRHVGRPARPRAWRSASTRPGGTAPPPSSTPTRSTTRATPRSSSGTGSG